MPWLLTCKCFHSFSAYHCQNHVFCSFKHSGNSCTLLDPPPKAILLPAHIEHIVQFVSNDDILSVITLVAVQRFKPHNTHSDPFSPYLLLQIQIWSHELQGTLELHPVNAIQCHFACSTMLWEGEKVMIVISLSCVCPHSNLFLSSLKFPKEF